MRYSRLIAGALLSLTSMGIPHTAIATDLQGDELANAAAVLAQQQQSAGIALADEIWNLAELGYLEYRSSGALQRYLSGNDFKVETGAGAFLPPLSPAIDQLVPMNLIP